MFFFFCVEVINFNLLNEMGNINMAKAHRSEKRMEKARLTGSLYLYG